MDLHAAIEHPDVNAFEIESALFGEFIVITYRRPNETNEQYNARHIRNYEWAVRFKERQKENRKNKSR